MLKKSESFIWITTAHEGIHCYPAAAADPKLATGDHMDVSFLAHKHRHMFHIKFAIQVFNDDRDLEFIQVKRQIDLWIKDKLLELNHKSCEMIADDLAAIASQKWPNRKMIIDVSEDGENGSTTHYDA